MKPTTSLTDTTSDSPRLIRNSIFLLGIEIVTKLLGLIFFIYLARFLGASELGLYAYAITLANFFVLVPRFGFESLVQREVGRDHASAWLYFRAISALKGILAVPALLGLVVIAVFTVPATDLLVVLLVGCFAFSYSFLEFVDSLFRALERTEFEVLVRLWFSLANLTLGMYLLYSGRGLQAVVVGQLASITTAVLLGLIVLQRQAPAVCGRLDLKTLRQYVISAAPFATIVVALYFSNQMGILILSLFANKTEVGYLAAGLRLFDNLTLIPAALMGAFLPVVSRYYRTSIGAFTTTLRFTLKYLFIFSVPLAVGLLCLSTELTILLFKEEFLPTAAAMKILALALVFSFWNYLGDNVLIARNQEKRLFRLTWLSAGFHIAANLALTPYFSYLGACWATVLTQAFYFAILFFSLRRYLSIATLIRLVWRPTIAASIMGFGILGLRSLPPVIVIFSGMVIYMSMLLITKTLTMKELGSLREVWKTGQQKAQA